MAIKTDTFSGEALNTVLTAHTSDVGSGWAGADSGAYVINVDGVVNNRVAGHSSGNRALAVGNENPASPDYYVSVYGIVNAVGGATDAANNFGAAVRCDGATYASANCYYAFVAGDGQVILIKLTSPDTRTTLGTYNIAGFVETTQYGVLLRAENSGADVALTVEVDEGSGFVQRITHTDVAPAAVFRAAGNVGMYTRSPGGSRNPRITSLDSSLIDAAPVVTNVSVADASLIDSHIFSVTITATDDVGVTGYAVTTSATPPGSAQQAGSTINFDTGDYGSFNLYGWAFDASNNVSAAFTPVSVQAVNSTASSILIASIFNGGFVA